ncbi:TetR-like C-terminal domain-containing protein [Escherichia coli]
MAFEGNFVEQHRFALRHLLVGNHAYRFQQAICQPFEQHLLHLFQKAGEDYIHPAPAEYVARYHIGGIARILTVWLQNSHAQTEEFIKQTDILLRHALKECLKS